MKKKRKYPLFSVGAIDLAPTDQHQLSLFNHGIIVPIRWELANGTRAVLEFPPALYAKHNYGGMRIYGIQFDRGLPVKVAELMKHSGDQVEFNYVDATTLEPFGGVFSDIIKRYTNWEKWSDPKAYESAYNTRLNMMLSALLSR